MKLSKKQEQIVKAKENKVLVICAAASGKTHCLTERVKYLINNYPENNIVAITFTNTAAEEIKKRIDFIPNTVFIGTIHSYCNYLLLNNGISTSDIIDEGRFDDLLHTFIDSKINQKVDYLLLDEGQDSTKLEFNFLLEQLKPKNWMIFADIRQSIYGFRGAYPDYIIDLSYTEGVTVYNLNENYRNGANILDFAKQIIEKTGLIDDSIPMRNKTGKVIRTPLSLSAIVRDIKKYDNYKDWAILTRTNSEAEEVFNLFKKNNIPCDTFKQGDLEKCELSKKMNDNTIKILTIHSAKGLEWDNVIVIGARAYSDTELNISYVAATRARDMLIWTTNPIKKKKIVNWE